jgi:hypothetical protein
MSDTEIIAQLKKTADIFEAYRVTSFFSYRKTKSVETQKVLVEIRDAGEDSTARYHVIATAGDKQVSGNANASLESALAIVHWWDLD